MLLGEQAPIWGGVFARFRDIDGNSFALVSFDEVTHRLELQRRAEVEEQESEQRAHQELEIAKQVQARLFPQRQPQLKGLEYDGVCIQARKVGGDYYDFLDLGEARLGLVIGDIAGKGIAAALLMANLQANVRSQCAVALDQPQRLLRSVNPTCFVKIHRKARLRPFFAEYDDNVGRLRYANCGHLSALLRDVTERWNGSIPQARCWEFSRDWDCAIGERQFHCGEYIRMYTDGVTESFNSNGEEFEKSD
jgi:serine phosphatase RsbU (regulator of sigma subunit)